MTNRAERDIVATWPRDRWVCKCGDKVVLVFRGAMPKLAHLTPCVRCDRAPTREKEPPRHA